MMPVESKAPIALGAYIYVANVLLKIEDPHCVTAHFFLLLE
jgi:hypothetical protein